MSQSLPLMNMPSSHSGPIVNGINGHLPKQEVPTLEDLESELPVVNNDQIPLSEVLSRVVQDIYAELLTLSDTLPSSSDSARKRMLADFVVKHKKQVVKLFAVVKWARDAEDVQKCMNITAFLMDQNAQFEEAVEAVTLARESLAPARLRNHDLLTSLDVLTTGSYLRLPTAIKKLIIPPKRLSKDEISQTLSSFDHLIRFRLRMSELVPVEMNKYSVSSAQAHFHVPGLFSVSLSLRGSEPGDAWFMVDVEFDIKVGGDDTGVVAFPRSPTGITKRYIADEADARLARYMVVPTEMAVEPDIQPGPSHVQAQPPGPKLPENAVDAPLMRLYNFMQMMSLSYQLEILHYQAQRMRSLGWADYLKVEFSKDRKTLTVTYWIRQPAPPRPPNAPQFKTKIPLLGGTLSISVEPKCSTGSRGDVNSGSIPKGMSHPPGRSHKDRVLHEIGLTSKLRRTQGTVAPSKTPSDEVERLHLMVKWSPEATALGFLTAPSDWLVQYEISSSDLDFQGLLTKAVRVHSQAILKVFSRQLCEGPYRSVFPNSDEVVMSMDGDTPALQIFLCAGEVVVVTIDPRTGRLNLRDTGDLAAAGRGPRFAAVSEKINENPIMIVTAIVSLRYNTIVESAEQKAVSLGLQTYRHRNMSREELAKFGASARAHLFVQLQNFPTHYLVLVIADDDFKFALVSVKSVVENAHTSMVMDDIGWLDVARIRGNEIRVQLSQFEDRFEAGMKRKAVGGDLMSRTSPTKPDTESFKLESEVIRELYAYCCARVSHTKVEQQLKSRGIPYTHVSPSASPEFLHEIPRGIHSSLASSVPVLCVQSKDILSGVPAAEAAMPNIRVVPINWWSERKCQVVTCVKLKYVQPPVGKTAGMGSTVIRPSKSVIYDTREAIVSFLSEDVNTCVDEFLDEWARVSTIVVIAREVSQMAKAKHWDDVRLLSFDLQTVEFTYTTGYALSISCTNQQSTGGSYQLRFSRVSSGTSRAPGVSLHDEAAPFLRPLLRNGRLATSLAEVVDMLRDTLPMALELESLTRDDANKPGAAGLKVDVFPKACGWYRVLLGDLRHALDFRLMAGKKVVILDGSYSIFGTIVRDTDLDAKERGLGSEANGTIGVLQAIPDFHKVIEDVVHDIKLDCWGAESHSVALIGVGLVCHVSVAGKVGLAVLRRVADRLSGVR
ncbi:mediator complex subunit MED14-domain-containing protein [Gautieria morchelliformis]|nr:mediator complex subunit MED14-domain-containing protein [Gautieria morchelliformis]